MKWYLVLMLMACGFWIWAEEAPVEVPAAWNLPLAPEAAAVAQQEFTRLSSPDAATCAQAALKLKACELAVLPWLKRQYQDESTKLSPAAKAAAADVIKFLELRNDTLAVRLDAGAAGIIRQIVDVA